MTDRTIAHYEIIGKLGQGGMGEVYRATDTKLDREVAIKVLPKSFAEDATRLARFEREAKVLAALNHPNIAVIYSIEQSVETQALIMELVEGETLGERLQREPMTIPEALDCCRQIANALEAAHDKGIIHRDLKPENVKIDQEGRVKVLDFGLAKEVVDPASSGNQAESPTITHMTTVPGELLGTAPYMSPEQARGRPVDKRSDIWSFGCVLYECLTGNPMFHGEDVTETLASIIKGEPDWDALPEDTPPTIELLLRKCLNKDRKKRLRDIGDARIDIEQALGDPSSSITRLSDRALQDSTKPTGIHALLAMGGMVLAALVSIVLTWLFKPQPPIPPVRHVISSIGVAGRLRRADASAVRFSPDGSMIAFMAAVDGSDRTQLYLRRLDQLEARPVAAAGAIDEFCFSPDGLSIAFRDTEDDRIKRVEVEVGGGSAKTICRAEGAYGIDWSEGGWIVFAEATGGLWRVSDNGGTPEQMTTPTGTDVTHRWPRVLPGGNSILYTAHTAQGGFEIAKIMFQRLHDGEAEEVVKNASHPLYLPSGYVLFMRGLDLFGVPFDPAVGPGDTQPVPLIEGIWATLGGAGHLDVSAADGSLVYLSVAGVAFNLQWVNRTEPGETMLPGDAITSFYQFDLSADGRQLVYHHRDRKRMYVWIYDIKGAGAPRRLMFGSTMGLYPIWDPAGGRFVYTEWPDPNTLRLMNVDGSVEPHPLYQGAGVTFVRAWHPGGTYLIVYIGTKDGYGDLRLLELRGNDQSGWQAQEVPYFDSTPFIEANAGFSRDGKWVAYDSDESGRLQVYVRSFPEGGVPRLVSLPEQEAYCPVWSPSTDELFYLARSGDLRGQVYIVHYSVEDGVFQPEPPVPWPAGITYPANPVHGGFDVQPDGERLLVRVPAGDEAAGRSDRLVLVQGFASEVNRDMAAGGRQP